MEGRLSNQTEEVPAVRLARIHHYTPEFLASLTEGMRWTACDPRKKYPVVDILFPNEPSIQRTRLRLVPDQGTLNALGCATPDGPDLSRPVELGGGSGHESQQADSAEPNDEGSEISAGYRASSHSPRSHSKRLLDNGSSRAESEPGHHSPGQTVRQRSICTLLHESVPRCATCAGEGRGGECLFLDLRGFPGGGPPVEPRLNPPPILLDDDRKPELPIYPSTWNIQPTLDHCRTVLSAVARALVPVLKIELQHLGQTSAITRNREIGCRIECDYCLTAIFGASWVCQDCGREYCTSCHARIGRFDRRELKCVVKKDERLLLCREARKHQHARIIPVSRFRPEDLEDAISKMEAFIVDQAQHLDPIPDDPSDQPTSWTTRPAPPDPAGVGSLPYHVFTSEEATEDKFRPLWARGEAVVVTGVLGNSTGSWTPQEFATRFGDQVCGVVECETDEVWEMTVGSFFEKFGQYDKREPGECLKLKDWPPTSNFRDIFPDLYQDFARSLPFPNYSRLDGVLNIASHFPQNDNAINPDIGPKMYNAFKSSEGAGGHGSTRLHMDMADAVNIMFHASSAEDGGEGCAVWDIYRAEDSNHLRRFIKGQVGFKGEDPIHSQEIYLDVELRKQLASHGVKSWRIYQRTGEAVFIPAGCAHQVCNLADCIKVACDFVSPENIPRCEVLTEEFRRLNQGDAWKEDVLELRQTMLHAWNSMIPLYENLVKNVGANV